MHTDAFFDELAKIAALTLPQMEQVIARLAPSRIGALIPRANIGGTIRRMTLPEVAQSEGLARATELYRQTLRHVQTPRELPLATRLKAFKQYKATGELPRLAGRPSKMRVSRGSVTPIGGEGTVTLTSHGPVEGLRAAAKDPASRLEAFYMPGKTKPVREGLFFWEGPTSAKFTASPRSLGPSGQPGQLTLEIPRSKVYATGKHKELNPLGERIVSADDIKRYAKNIKIDPL